MIRVLHVITTMDPRWGGTTAALRQMASDQAGVGLDVTIVAGRRADDAPLTPPNEFKLKTLGPCAGPLWRAPGMASAVRELVRESDVVHIHGMWEELLHQAALAARAADVPYVVTPHGMLTRWSLAQSRLKKQVYLMWRGRRNLRRAAALHCTSGGEAADVEALRPGPPVLIEPLAVDWTEFATLPPPGRFRAVHPALGERPVIAFLGRIHPGKGVELLIPALAKLARSDAMLVVVGPDSEGYRARMEQLARTFGVQDRVIFTGMLRGEDKVAALADADLFALPSEHENFGMSVVEALAAGTPVVISDQVNIRREIESAGVGAVVPNDPRAVADAIDRWLADPELRRQASAKARPFVRATYDGRGIALRWQEHYRRLAGQPLAEPDTHS